QSAVTRSRHANATSGSTPGAEPVAHASTATHTLSASTRSASFALHTTQYAQSGPPRYASTTNDSRVTGSATHRHSSGCAGYPLGHSTGASSSASARARRASATAYSYPTMPDREESPPASGSHSVRRCPVALWTHSASYSTE